MAGDGSAAALDEPTASPVQVEEAAAFEHSTERTTFFHGVNLRTQPVLTKRGRKTGKIVSRVFVIVEGTLRLAWYGRVSRSHQTLQATSFTSSTLQRPHHVAF
jgi:hypothetical protein